MRDLLEQVARPTSSARSDFAYSRVRAQVGVGHFVERWTRQTPAETLLFIIVDVHAGLAGGIEIACKALWSLAQQYVAQLIAQRCEDTTGAEFERLTRSRQEWLRCAVCPFVRGRPESVGRFARRRLSACRGRCPGAPAPRTDRRCRSSR